MDNQDEPQFSPPQVPPSPATEVPDHVYVQPPPVIVKNEDGTAVGTQQGQGQTIDIPDFEDDVDPSLTTRTPAATSALPPPTDEQIRSAAEAFSPIASATLSPDSDVPNEYRGGRGNSGGVSFTDAFPGQQGPIVVRGMDELMEAVKQLSEEVKLVNVNLAQQRE